ncbi:MAG: dTMP kinase [Hyphomicrobiaceae bacterium]
MRGKFITFEGGEGAGKSTQARLLAERLRAAGRDVLVTREPGGSPFAEQLRTLILDPAMPPHAPLAEALLFSAARSDHVETVIRPALSSGRWVICDRFADSTRVYQGAAGGLASETLQALERIVVADTRPDLTVLIDLDPAEGLARVGRRGAAAGTTDDAYETRGLAYHQKLRAGFLALAAAEPRRVVVVDGSATVEAIASDVLALVGSRLGTLS